LQQNAGNLGMERLKYAPTGKVRTKLRGSSCVLKGETTVSVGTTLAILWLGNTTSQEFKCQDYSDAPCGNHHVLSFVYNFNQNDILTSRMIPEVHQTRATKPQFHKNWG